ncbi:MAG: hypothetical protein OXF62_17795 [Caldilineaceae bacterium]|nr:hypothetical protein [Caldilineaceae bacterium]
MKNLCLMMLAVLAASPVLGGDGNGNGDEINGWPPAGDTHLSITHRLEAELSRHWSFADGWTVAGRVVFGDGKETEIDCTVGDKCGNVPDAEQAGAILVEAAENGVKSLGVSLGRTWEVRDFDIAVSAGGRWHPNVTAHGVDHFSYDDVSFLVEVRLTRDALGGYVSLEHGEPNAGGIGSQAVKLVGDTWQLGDHTAVVAAAFVRF